MLEQHLVEVPAPEVGIEAVRQHLHPRRVEGDDGDLRVALADVDERDAGGAPGAAEVGAVESVAQRGGGEVVHEAERPEPRDGGGVEVGAALRLGEVAGHGDHAVGDGGAAEVGLRELLEVGEQHGEEVGRGERDAAADVVGVDDGAAADGEGEAGEVAVEGGLWVPPRGAEEEALDAGEGGVRGRGGRGVAADEARVVGEGDGGGGLALGLGVEEHVDAPLPRRRRHQGVVADVEADHAHRRRFGVRSARMGRRGPCDLGRGAADGDGDGVGGERCACAGGYGPRTLRWPVGQGGAGPAVLTPLSPTGGAAAFCLLWGRGAGPLGSC